MLPLVFYYVYYGLTLKTLKTFCRGSVKVSKIVKVFAALCY